MRLYVACPRRYYYAYGEGVFDPPTPATRLGNYLHAVLEEYLKELVKARRPRDLELLFAIARRRRADDRSLPDEGKHSYAEADVMLNAFASKPIDPEAVFGLEKPFRVMIEGEPVAALEGRIDRIDLLRGRGEPARRGEERLHVIDYKSGTHALTEAELAEDLQMQAYVVAAHHLYRRRFRLFTFTLIYLRDGSEVSVETPYREEVRERLAALMTRIREDREYPRCVGRPCRRCPAFKACAPDMTGVADD